MNKWILKLGEMPNYDGEYLCNIAQVQPCGTVWNYYKVVPCRNNKWHIGYDEIVLSWKELPESPEFENLEIDLQNSLEEDNLIFSPSNLSNIFTNINHKPCSSIGYDLAWDITDKGKFVGELFYSQEDKEWFFIKDNYPMPRKGYRINFPITDNNFFINLFKSLKITLIKNI